MSQTSVPEVSVVVPVFGNASTLDELIDRQIAVLEKLGVSFELIFVDDGSRDHSLELLLARASQDPRIRPFAMTRNFGGQSAMCAGFAQVRGKRAVCMDADLENFPEDIPALLAPLDEGHDLVCGVREDRQGAFLTRRLPSRLMNAYVRRQTATKVRDIGCAMRAMDAHVIQDFDSEGERRRLVTPLLLRRAHSVAEVPIQHRPKDAPGGHSFFTLLGIAFDYYLLTAKRPFLLTGVLSLVFAGLGVLVALSGESLPGLVLVSASVLAGLLSLIGEYAQRIYQISQGLPFYQLRDDVTPDAAEASPSPGDTEGGA